MTQNQKDKRSFKKTLNLPKTAFPMKANLVQNEPASMKRWAKLDVYKKLREARKDSDKGTYVFHDGPPYANGSIHLGHLLNKVLKDFVVRSKSMAGYDCPYTPGWDCHGLPIEHKVMQELGDKARDMVAPQIRKRCEDYAKKFVKLQAGQMQRLLTMADYDDPYLTMLPHYEGAVLEVFARLVEEGLVFRQLKPVHWSLENRTALADAELEYYDREDTSVYVKFEVTEPSDALAKATGGKKTSLMIWTTTPWTLPANMAVAVHERFEYGLYAVGDELVVLATELAGKVLALGGTEAGEPVATLTGAELASTKYVHPFVDRIGPTVLADYVTLEDGTGLVHTATGHGVEDYQTGLREGLEIYCPVLGDGTFDNTAPDWLQGKSVWDANGLVCDHLTKSGHMFHQHQFTHSYPHDWRGKTPVIFRATEQWFVGVDRETKSTGKTLRDLAMGVTADGINFIPAWGRNRMRGMLESRPDWCISRQRAWGLPIPAFDPPQGVDGEPLLTAASVRAVSEAFRKHGSDAWFKLPARELLETYDVAGDPDAPAWVQPALDDNQEIAKPMDIFDVWFESGSSWNACMRERGQAKADEAPGVTDLYLEGSDQHRGWFQLSLLPCLGATGKTPFETVLTHGFMVDKDGKKMSKSGGNATDVEELLKELGADVCRWWVSTLNVDNDIKVDMSFFQLAGEAYRKIRNTVRFLLSNLNDFDFDQQRTRFEDEDATSIDAWATGELIKLSDKVLAAYDRLNFREASELLYDYCNDSLSSVYLSAVKDRMYCDAPDSPRRRRAQTTVYRIAGTLTRLLAPLLPHTADEAWRALEGEDAGCVHLKTFANVDCMRQIPVSGDWSVVMDNRDKWLKAIEDFRQANDLDNPLDVGLTVGKTLNGVDLSQFVTDDLADLCNISRVTLVDQTDTVNVVDLRGEDRCERSWKRDGSVQSYDYDGEPSMLSKRDAQALGLV